MTMNQMKKMIQVLFRKTYGFAPMLKEIRPLETSQTGESYTAMAFHVNHIGYTYSIECGLHRAVHYDINLTL